MPLYKNCGRLKYFDCIFGFRVKSYVRNTINLSWDKILLTSVIIHGQLNTKGTITNLHCGQSAELCHVTVLACGNQSSLKC
jgi:hypothetical protein